MKVLLVILDGLTDRPCSKLNSQTPLQVAQTPNLDNLAQIGATGMMYPVAPGIAPSTDLAHFILLGYPPDEFPGRGYLEALGQGLRVKKNQVVLSTIFVSVKEEENHFQIVAREIEAEENKLEQLAGQVEEQILSDIKLTFLYSKKREGFLFLEGPVSPEITDSDPFSSNLPVIAVQPLSEAKEPEKAARTAQALNKFLIATYERLKKHPLNQQRTSQGLLPLNFLATKWVGMKKTLDSFTQRYDFKGISLASGSLYRGLSQALGLDFFKMSHSDDAEKDLREKLKQAKHFLNQEYDFAYVHTKAPDVAAHTKNPTFKKEVIGRLDKAFDVLIDDPPFRKDTLIIITSDHSTPSQGDLIHSGEPVCLLMIGENVGRDEVAQFDELSCRQGKLACIYGKDLMPLILNYTDKAKYLGSRPFPKDFPTKPSPRRIIPLKRTTQ